MVSITEKRDMYYLFTAICMHLNVMHMRYPIWFKACAGQRLPAIEDQLDAGCRFELDGMINDTNPGHKPVDPFRADNRACLPGM